MKWTDGYIIAIEGGRYGNCLTIGHSSGYASLTLDSQATWIVGFAFKFDKLPTTDRTILVLWDNSTEQCSLVLQTNGKLAAYRDTTLGTLLGTGTTALNADTWYFLETKVTISDAAGVFVVRINGNSTADIDLSSVDTKVSANASGDVIRLYGESSNKYYYDDLYICDNTGTTNNDFLGDVRVEALFVSGAGSTTQWTPSAGSNYACVDEAATDFPNEDTDYVSSSTAAQVDTYAMDDLDYTTGTVYAVQALTCAKKEDAGTVRKVQNRVVRTGTSEGTAEALSSDSYAYVRDIFETRPATGAWTIADVNAVEAGFELDT